MLKKIIAILDARNKDYYRDRAALIWSFLFPFIVLAGFTYGYSGKQDPALRIRTLSFETSTEPNNPNTLPLLERLKQLPGVEIASTTKNAALKALERFEVDLVLEPKLEGKSSLNTLTYYFNPNSDKSQLAKTVLIQMQGAFKDQTLEPYAVAGNKLRYSDWLLPGLLATNLMFGSMFGVGYVIVRYRKTGVLKRLRATPLSAFQFLFAQILSRLFLMLLTSFLVLWGSMILIGFKPQGSWLDLALFLSFSSMAMISVGLVVAAQISSEEVADGLLNLMSWPMLFLSGVWFSIDGASSWVLTVANFLPLTHVVAGLRGILLEGMSTSQLYSEMGILAAFSLVFLCISCAVFRWR